jgi:hypothetical protein
MRAKPTRPANNLTWMKLESNAPFILFFVLFFSSYIATAFSLFVRYCPHPAKFNPFAGSGEIATSRLHE